MDGRTDGQVDAAVCRHHACVAVHDACRVTVKQRPVSHLLHHIAFVLCSCLGSVSLLLDKRLHVLHLSTARTSQQQHISIVGSLRHGGHE